MTKETHDFLYNTTLENMDDEKEEYFDKLLAGRNEKLLLQSFAGALTAVSAIFAIINSWMILIGTFFFFISFILFSLNDFYTDSGLSKKEFSEFKKSGGLKRIKELLKEYKKICKLDGAENKKTTKFEETKQKQHDNKLYYEAINDVDINFVSKEEDEQDLIKQLSERKAAEKASQTGTDERVENNNKEILADNQQDEIVSEENNNKNL